MTLKTCSCCPKYESCIFSYKDMSTIEHICPEHPHFVGHRTINTLDTVVIGNTLSSMAPSPTPFLSIIHISDSVEFLEYKGRNYKPEVLEVYRIIIEKRVAIDYLKALRQKGTLNLKEYNNYIDTSLSKPLTQEEFDFITEYI